MGFIKYRPLPVPGQRFSPASRDTPRWQVFSPVVYRYLEQRWVDAFFEDGTLRLTSFARCRQHADEQRLDNEEGVCRILVRDREHGNALALQELEFNPTAYVLCTTLWHNRSLMEAFGCDSF